MLCDRGFAGAEFEQLVRSLGASLLRSDRWDKEPCFGSLGGARQWIESALASCKRQLSLERHGGRTLSGLVSCIARRLLALAAHLWHNWLFGTPGRSFNACDH